MSVCQKRVLLIIGGGIAAYKSLELIRELGRSGIATRVILTKAGREFVTPLSAASLSGDKVYSDLFDLKDEAEMGHIALSREADLVVVCPATADLMAKAAAGIASDLATTTLLATDKPVIMVPAMNVRMWRHKATQRNIAQLRADGVVVMDPDEGDMACGEHGPGRLPEVARIANKISSLLSDGPLKGKKAIITAGPTREAIDPVRYLSNHSSGKQGYAIAESLAELGADVTLISGPTMLPPPSGVTFISVESAEDMLNACEDGLSTDVFIAVAAVADWRPENCADQKLKKHESGLPKISLRENPDILKTIANHKNRPSLVIGFAAETHNIEEYATAKRFKKNCDWVVANDVSGDVMGGDHNQITLICEKGSDTWPEMPKADIAKRLADEIAEHFKA